jgi:superfamily II helicase
VPAHQPKEIGSKLTLTMTKMVDYSKEPVQLERHALIRFESQEEAWRAARNTNGNFLLRQSIAVKVI